MIKNKKLSLSFIKKIISEEIQKMNDISDIKGKCVESIQVNDTTIIVHFDDESKLVVQSTDPENKIEYQYHRGTLKSQGTEGGFGKSPF